MTTNGESGPREAARVIPPARRGDADRPGGAAAPDGTGRPEGRLTRWRRRGWDIPWLGGRSTAPWVVLVTVLVLALAGAGTVVAAMRPDRLGFSTKTVVATSDSTVEFTFSVFKAPGATAACDIVAADRDGGVGTLRDIPIPPRADGEQNTQLTVTVPTTRRHRGPERLPHRPDRLIVRPT